MNWVSTNDQLPPARHCILAHILRSNWKDQKEDPFGVHYKVVWIEYGISEAMRQQMKDGLLNDPEEVYLDGWGNVRKCKRSATHRSCDEGNNNERPYCWHEFGPGGYFGQEVDYWCEFERLTP